VPVAVAALSLLLSENLVSSPLPPDLLDAGVERAFLVGHSMGTPVARQCWRKYPAKTLGIAAVDLAIWKDDPIKAPLLVLVAKSPMWSADYFAYVKTLNPDAKIVEIAGAGHFVMLERPAEVNAALVAFAAKAGAIPKPSPAPAP